MAPAPGPAAVLQMQRSVGNRAMAGILGGALRTLPGGNGTRPMPLGPAPPQEEAPAAGPRAPGSARDEDHGSPVPASVAATVGPLGADILRAAAQPTPASPKPQVPLDPLGAGEPIPAPVRAPFERSFGYDLSPIRLHRGPEAQSAAAAAGAAAFTLSDHIVLGGDLDLASPAGRHIVGHELAHTVQSRLGAGSGGAAGAAGRISDPTWSSEREAERAAASATANGRYEIRERGGDDLHRIAPG